MDKSMLVYLALGVVFVYVIMNLTKIADEPDIGVNSYQRISYDHYEGINSEGQIIVNFSELSNVKQIDAWKGHPLRKEWMHLFPDFPAMKSFIDTRVKGQFLHSKVMGLLNEIEKKYYSGEINMEQAKQRLGKLQ